MRRQIRLCGVILVAAVAVMCCTNAAWASAKQVGDQVQEQPAPPDRGSVIVYFDANADRGPARRFVSNNGGVAHYEYKAVLPNAINFRNLPDTAIAGLQRIPGVVRVERDEYHANLIKLHDSTPLIRALQSQITGAGYSADGAGVRVCVCDTGIDSDHMMYSDRIDASAGYDFYNDDSDPEDDHGHGSHVSGIAVGGTGLSVDFGCGAGDQVFQGVAPEATLIGAKILNQFGGGYDSDIIAGIDHCADQSPSGGRADVINLSIGTGQYSGPCTHSWAVAANNAVANGVVVVAASGNDNYSNAMSSPACGVDVIAVGMTWKADYPTCEDPTTNWYWSNCTDYGPQTDDIGCFSNESDYLDVAAPGANIWSASNAAGGSSITGMSGTSMSSPQVVGLAALILSVDDTLTPAEVRQIIRDGAIDMGPAGFDRAYGYGRIDVLDTLALVQGCTTNEQCADGNECTDDLCVEGVCQNPAVPDNTLCTGGVCCGGECTVPVCETSADCDDQEPCTTDSCVAPTSCGAFCENLWPTCGLADGCCGPACEPGNDPDCTCVPAGGYCTSDADCCSLSCHPAKNYCR